MSLQRLSIWALVAAALLAMGPGLADPYINPKLPLLLLAALPLLLRPSSTTTALQGPLDAVLAVWVLTAYLGKDHSYSLVGSYTAPFDCLLSVVVYTAAMVAASRSGLDAWDVARAVVVLSLPLAAYALLQAVIGNADPVLPGPLPGGRVIATQGSPIYLGALLALCLVVATAVGHREPWPPALAACVVLPLALAATQTRGAVLAALVGLVSLHPRRRVLLAGAALAGIMVLGFRAGAGRSDLGRLALWDGAMAAWQAAPWLGHGPGTFSTVYRQYITPAFLVAHHSAYAAQDNAHNLLLHVLATTGLLGAAAVAWLATATWRRVARCQDDGARYLVQAAMAAAGVVACLNPVPTSVYVVLALLVGAVTATMAQPGPLRRAWATALMVMAALPVAGRLVAADYHYAKGHRARGRDPYESAVRINRAAQLNPWEMAFTARQLDAFMDLFGSMTPHDRRNMAMVSLDLAHRAAARHPHDSFAYEILGRAILVASATGTDVPAGPALAYFKQAHALAPTFPPVLRRIEATARALGDARTRRWAQAELTRLDVLERNHGDEPGKDFWGDSIKSWLGRPALPAARGKAWAYKS